MEHEAITDRDTVQPPRPLSGVRVLDLSRVVSGPVCSRMLADLGAEVIKVEAADGDVSRVVPPHVDGTSAYFSQLNAGKLGTSIDLRTPAGAALVGRLMDASDVVLENFRPGVLSRFGLGWDDVRERLPRLIYCSLSGWGQHNSWSERRAYAPLVHAEVGLLDLASRLRDSPPRQEVHVHGDIYPGLLAASAVLAALFEREHTGVGQHLDVAMAEALSWCNEWASSDLAGLVHTHPFDIWTHPAVTLADGSQVAIVGHPVRQLALWAEVLGHPDTPAPDSVEAATALIQQMAADVPDVATLEERCAGRPVLMAQIRSIGALAESPWAAERAAFVEHTPGVRIPRSPFRSSTSDIGAHAAAPALGAHTAEVLRRVLGLADAEIADLAASGAIIDNGRPSVGAGGSGGV